MKDIEKIMKLFEKDGEKIFTPKKIENKSGLNAKRVRSALTRLLKEEKIVRVSRGKYRRAQVEQVLSRDHLSRYLTTLEKTCEIAIHELMLTEPLVGKEDKAEIEHQIAYFARHLVKARWVLDKGSPDMMDINEEIFSRARKIHDWSKFVLEDSISENK